MNVLIVEDERKLADVLEHILKEQKYIVFAFARVNVVFIFVLAVGASFWMLVLLVCKSILLDASYMLSHLVHA
jgi:DNA-binding response OmpR family regulator